MLTKYAKEMSLCLSRGLSTTNTQTSLNPLKAPRKESSDSLWVAAPVHWTMALTKVRKPKDHLHGQVTCSSDGHLCGAYVTHGADTLADHRRENMAPQTEHNGTDTLHRDMNNSRDRVIFARSPDLESGDHQESLP